VYSTVAGNPLAAGCPCFLAAVVNPSILLLAGLYLNTQCQGRLISSDFDKYLESFAINITMYFLPGMPLKVQNVPYCIWEGEKQCGTRKRSSFGNQDGLKMLNCEVA